MLLEEAREILGISEKEDTVRKYKRRLRMPRQGRQALVALGACVDCVGLLLGGPCNAGYPQTGRQGPNGFGASVSSFRRGGVYEQLQMRLGWDGDPQGGNTDRWRY